MVYHADRAQIAGGVELVTTFSLIIPTFNRADLIGRTLESVFAQTRLPDEIIVVDDGSTDGTLDLLASYGSKICVMTQANRGPGAARNLGVRHATGDYVVFLDSDDLWFPWTLATYARVIEEHGSPAFVSGKLFLFRNSIEPLQITQAPLREHLFTDYFASSHCGVHCSAGQAVIRRDIYLDSGGFVEEKINAEDHDLVMRLGTKLGFVWIEAPEMVAYRQHAAAVTKDLSKTLVGSLHLYRMEKEGQYPGGASRRRDRWRILTRHLRPVTLELLRQRDTQHAWSLYGSTFLWNLALGRFRYLIGFTSKALLGRLSATV